MFWNPEVITTTGKSLRITQIPFNIIYIMRTNITQGRIQSLTVMPHASSTCGLYGLPAIFHTQHALSIAIAFIT